MPVDFRRLFEAAPALFMVLAPDPPRFTILAASDAYLRAVMKRREDLVGRPVFEALPVGPEAAGSEVNSRASFERAITLRVPDTMAVQRHDLVRPDPDGGGFETRYWSPVNSPVLDEHGDVLYVLHRVEDVTEFVQAKQQGAEHEAIADALRTRAGEMEVEIYRRAQEIQEINRSLRAANDRLGELGRAKTAFLSNVSHELRTPLTLILGTLEELLRRNDLPSGTLGDLTVAHRNSMRLLKLVNALLDFSRIEAGRAQASYQPTDLGTLTAALASSFQSACEKAGLRLRITSPPSRTPIHVDREMWETIVLNLLSNAFKFTHEGEIEVKLEQRPGGCTLSVTDTGVGIPAAELPRIFERFHRVPSMRGRSLEGTGIGLSLVHELVKLHGGTVGVHSTPGQGSTFTVELPAGAAHPRADRLDAAGPAPSPSSGAQAFVGEALRWLPGDASFSSPSAAPADVGAQPSAGGPDAARRRRVLLADDNADMREHIGRLLAPRFEVIAVSDGQEAIEAARRIRPDLVLADVMMPRLDGFGLLRQLRADPDLRVTPLILVSARAGEEAKGEGLELGADDYLIKPFSARELRARVASNLQLAEMREEVARAVAREAALEDTDRRKNAFLAMLSHELRNPLAPIRNSLYILERAAAGGEQAKRARQVIDRQVAHLSRMVEDLLDVSRITQGKLQLQEERLQLDQLVRRVVEEWRPVFERQHVALRADLSGEPLVVRGDPTRLAQAVGNLLGNAARFTPPGGHVRLSLRSDPGSGDDAVLCVRDDGGGVPRDVVEHLFEPFVQAEQTIARSTGGLGLGLAIVKGIVEAHGGRVAAHSRGAGKGTEMTVRLPRRDRREPHGSPGTVRPRGADARRVLIIEDNDDAAHSLKDALELDGHAVELASDGEAGLERSRAFRPDAIVCDIGLPRMDGHAVARAIRADPVLRAVCLIAVTGYAALDDVDRSRAAGFDHHLAKPPDLGVLARILDGCKAESARSS